jgi:hypothetical protein
MMRPDGPASRASQADFKGHPADRNNTKGQKRTERDNIFCLFLFQGLGKACWRWAAQCLKQLRMRIRLRCASIFAWLRHDESARQVTMSMRMKLACGRGRNKKISSFCQRKGFRNDVEKPMNLKKSRLLKGIIYLTHHLTPGGEVPHDCIRWTC